MRNLGVHSWAFSRRQWLQAIGVQALSLGLIDRRQEAAAGAGPSPAASLTPLNHFPHMVQEYFVERVRAAEQAGLKARATLKTRAEAEAYVREVRKKIQRCFDPFPEKTPLNARVTGTVERDAYKIDKVIFESRPHFLVTANLYVPKGKKPPLPGVVGTCGHSLNGKAAETYQSFAQGLARMGYVVLIYDPIGQGERLQYGHLDQKRRPRPGVGEHLHGGNQQFLVGEFFGSWRAWDGIRALDYLLSRPEVDPKHIGVTGNSGGGTMTTWLCGVEQRWTMAAPGCFVTTFRRNLENELPADTEQCPPHALALHLDHADFLAALAPKPVILVAKERDFFDVRGAEEAYGRLRRLYGLLGAEDNVKLFIGPTEHGYSQENREAMYQWFNHATRVSDARSEPKLTMEKDQTLWCTPNGQVAELKSRTVFSFTREKSQALAHKRGKLSEKELRQAVATLLRLPERAGVPEYRILRAIGGRKYPKPHATSYAVETERGVFAVVYRLSERRHDSRPSRGQTRAILYVAHHSSDAELRDEPLLAELLRAEPRSTLYTCDVRGIGESRPDTCGQNQFLTPYGSDYFYAIHALMLDAPYIGQKTFDVLRVLDWLKSFGHKEIHVVGKGWGSLPATFAALFEEAVVQVTLKHALTSYQDVAESENYSWPLSSFVPGVLEKLDLPDCYEALKGKKLRHIEPWGPTGEAR
ncbi:MAG TPA: acetylxylan esterase [Gemmataceae bacterium]|nr:acetylxylan esterase [Gemmataceae bacterium]